MKDETQKSLAKVFGWPDASWLRAWKMMDTELGGDAEGTRARNKLCKVAQIVVVTDVDRVHDLLDEKRFQEAHAYTNELLELVKMIRESCDIDWPTTRRDLRRRPVPTPAEPPQKKEGVSPAIRAKIEEIIKPAKFTRKERTELERFLKRERPEERVVVKKGRERGRVDIPTDILEELLAELPIEELPAPITPRKILSAKSREALNVQTDDLRKSSDRFKKIWNSLPEKKRNYEEAFTEAEVDTLDAAQMDLMGRLMNVLMVYKELEEEGFELPKGRLISYGTKGKKRENKSFEKRIEKASRTLAIVPPDDKYPAASLERIDNRELREEIMESLNEALKEA